MPKSSSAPSPKRDLYADVTANLVASIERDPGKPRLPWRRAGLPLFMPTNALTKNAYNGVNIVSLWAAAELSNYTAPIWATYKQWRELGAQVRAGEKASLVVFYKSFEVEPDAQDESDDGQRRMARASFVFNAAQVDGYTLPDQPPPLPPIARLEAADRFLAATGAVVRHGGDRAYYNRVSDHIQMPEEGLFTGTATMTRSESYYAVLAHEHVHWTGHDKRLARESGKRFGDAAYAAEELVAEIGSAFLCAELGITQDTRPDHAHYLANWLQLLKSDRKLIFTAAARAAEAVQCLRGLQ
jgi:antirestriction protein ArdC